MSRIELIKGSDLKLKLKRKGILQQDIVKKFGYNANTVSRYLSETNPMQMPASFILNVASFAKLNISDLIQGDENDIQDFIIDADWSEALPEIAAEPQAEYKAIPPPQEAPPPVVEQRPIISIDVSQLQDTLSHLQAQIDHIRTLIDDINSK